MTVHAWLFDFLSFFLRGRFFASSSPILPVLAVTRLAVINNIRDRLVVLYCCTVAECFDRCCKGFATV